MVTQTQQTEIKPDYKQTEIGIIPENWDVKKFEDLFEFLKTGTNPRSDLLSHGVVQYIHYGDIHAKWHSLLDCDSEEIPFIDKSKVKNLPFLKECDLIIADASEDYEGSGSSVVLKNVKERKIVSGLHTIALRPKNENISYGFIRYLTSIKPVKNQIVSHVTGISVYGLSKNNLRVIQIPLPSTIKEQDAIANVLTEIDELITQLDKLIEKKKNITQGAMQELLTGKIRLPGFNEEWKETILGEIGYIVNGGTPSTSIEKFWNGSILWCTPTDITNNKSKYISNTERKITKDGLNNSSATLLPKGSLLLCSRATIGEVKITTKEITTNQGFKSIVCFDGFDNEFIYYKILTIKNKLIEKSIGTTFLEISKKDTCNTEIYIPTSKIEQSSIAKILSDMDTEIEQLEKTRDKYLMIKKGMMQKLLTGEIRLL